MRLFRHSDPLPADLRGAALALGNFDGVHRGHAAIIEATRGVAQAEGRPYGVLTFEPHPRHLFRPGDPPFRLTPLRVKAREVAGLGADLMVVLHFDAAFAALAAGEFIDRVLLRDLGIGHIVVGYDFNFGKDRVGNADLLRRRASGDGFGLTVLEPVRAKTETEGEEVVSSTAIRHRLREGRPRAAAALLGRDWEIDGRVDHGDKRGRTIGFPTANLALQDYLRPRAGVYAVRVAIEGDAEWRPGVANIGTRPTVDGTDLRLEVNLFDFDRDIYGRHLRVALVDFLRPETRFDGFDALKAQIGLDAEQARRVLGIRTY